MNLREKIETNLAGVKLTFVNASCKLFVTVFSVFICDSKRCLFCRSSFRFRSRSVTRCLSRCRCVLIESYLIGRTFDLRKKKKQMKEQTWFLNRYFLFVNHRDLFEDFSNHSIVFGVDFPNIFVCRSFDLNAVHRLLIY